MRVFCVNGVALAGKDSFTERVANHFQRLEVKTCSTIDPVKAEYRNFFGWDGTKTPVHRKNLNVLKRIWIETSDGPMRYLENVINHNKSFVKILFVMVREFEEMEKSKNLALSLGCSAYTLEVVRDGLDIPPVEQEFLDSHPKDYQYDFEIYNPTVQSFPYLPALDTAAATFATMFKHE